MDGEVRGVREKTDCDAGVATDDGDNDFSGLAKVAQNLGDEGRSADDV